jgi:hypothetical protein
MGLLQARDCKNRKAIQFYGPSVDSDGCAFEPLTNRPEFSLSGSRRLGAVIRSARPSVGGRRNRPFDFGRGQ